ncbi:MAG: HNH endonuclease signature motif containing protein [Kofleriaceae bacterium]
MLDGGGSIEIAGLAAGELPMDAIREADWKELHRRLRSIAKRRVALEAEEAKCLVEAEETRLYRRLGYTTMLEYMERELHYGPHAANERLRVAHALGDLPLIAELFGEGELCFSIVRELTRVATPATEQAFVQKAQGKTAHQVQQLVAGLKPGDNPEAAPDPTRITKRVVIEVSVETYAIWRRTKTTLDEERGERLSDDEFVRTLCRRTSAAPEGELTPPAVQTAVTTCRSCKQTFIEGAGEALPVDEATAARLTCDAEHIGDLESDDLTRVTSVIPAAIRRKVFHRDHFACAVPGCRSTQHLDVHHITHRQHGGNHSMKNLMLACFGCHQRHHEGRLIITGHAPDHLQFTWKRDDDVESAMSGPSWDWMTVDAVPTENLDPTPRSGPALGLPVVDRAKRIAADSAAGRSR